MRLLTHHRPTILGWLLILALILLAGFLWDRYWPGRAYNRAHSIVTQELAEIQLSQPPVVNNSRSQCGDSYGKLFVEHVCKITGEKLYKGVDHFESDVRALDTQLKSLGWARGQCYGLCHGFDELFSKGGSHDQPLELRGEVYVMYTRSGREI